MKRLLIGKNKTQIVNNQFSGNQNIVEITISKTVEKIGAGAHLAIRICAPDGAN